ncbi:MAG: hypothetical protein ACE5HS_10060 [bacterium]
MYFSSPSEDKALLGRNPSADAIKIAEDAGFRERDYDREAIFTKKLWLQEFRGVAGFNFRTFFLAIDAPLITSHETGHTFGWRHASFWRVAAANPLSTEGTLIEYGDRFDIMGDTDKFHHFNPWLKFRAGWLPPESILTVSESGTYIIRALEKPPISGTSVNEYSALKIRRSPDTEYWVFYRSQEELANVGAILIQVRPSNTSRSLLLDMRPGSKLLNRDSEDAALSVGKTIRDEQAGIEIKVLEKNNDSLAVKVVVPAAPIDTLPVLDIVSPAFGKTVRGAVDYEVTAFDPAVGVLMAPVLIPSNSFSVTLRWTILRYNTHRETDDFSAVYFPC